MCYAYGSLDQAVNVCPMCKVFPNPRCPHVREVCRNRTNHPRADVLFLRNAEVDWFNGCGFCKWARTNPPPKLAGYYNPGWPGCCRPPGTNESRMIQAADWVAVSKVHHISIPPDVKALLESIPVTRGSPIPAAKATTLGRSASARIAIPNLDRRNSGSSSPSSKTASLSKATAGSSTPAMNNKGRSGGSPNQTASSLSRTSSGHAISAPSTPSSSSVDPNLFQRKLNLTESPTEKRAGDNVHSNHSSPSRKHLDLNESPSTHRRMSSASRPHSNAAVLSAANSQHNTTIEMKPTAEGPDKRRLSPTASRSSDRSPPSIAPRATPKREVAPLSSASSSSGSESFSDSTVTSDGGFTDYLSDESEAELQRQAEARAALLAQNQAEEMEFKAARQQLAHIDLRPPKTWNTSKDAASGGDNGRLASIPTAAPHFGRGDSCSASFAPGHVAYTASSRG